MGWTVDTSLAGLILGPRGREAILWTGVRFIRSGPRKPCVQPDRYDGSTAWNDYLARFEFCADINGWTDKEKVLFLAACFKGDAQKVLGDKRCHVSYTNLVKLLKQQFRPGQHAEMFLAELRGRQRKPEESLQEVGMKVRRLTKLAYPELSDGARDRLGRMHFADALDSREVRVALFQARPTSLDEAVKIATEVDSYLEVEKTRSSRAAPRHVRQLLTEEDKVVSLRKEIATLRGQLQRGRSVDLAGEICQRSFVTIVVKEATIRDTVRNSEGRMLEIRETPMRQPRARGER